MNASAMHVDPWTFATILGMAATTCICRMGGYALFRVVRPTPFVRAVLSYVPGTLFVAFVAPSLVGGGVQQWAGSAAALGAMIATRNLSWAIVAGVGAAWIVWSIPGLMH
jgi:uncharacterized membrane protein